jgi:hypothetical protein
MALDAVSANLANKDLHMKRILKVSFLPAEIDEGLTPKEVHGPILAHSLCMLTTSRASFYRQCKITNAKHSI